MTTVEQRDEYLRPKDVRVEYGISESTLQSWRATGVGPEWQPLGPRRIVYRRSAVEAFIAAERLRRVSAQAAS